ncbi:MAG: M48 family metallopeptidase [Ignavibacterium sp.]|nr:M48 family metallopeptidase [Ignavibacterium sp.]
MTAVEFKELFYYLADEIKVSNKIKQLRLRKMKRKLASCSTNGVITFDVSIIKFNNSEIIHIILHELLHLRYPNHGKLFKAMLKRYLCLYQHIENTSK